MPLGPGSAAGAADAVVTDESSSGTSSVAVATDLDDLDDEVSKPLGRAGVPEECTEPRLARLLDEVEAGGTQPRLPEAMAVASRQVRERAACVRKMLQQLGEVANAILEVSMALPTEQHSLADQLIQRLQRQLTTNICDGVGPDEVLVKRPTIFSAMVPKQGRPLGVGVIYHANRSTSLTVSSVHPSGAARKADTEIAVGDRIVAVNGCTGGAEKLLAELAASDFPELRISRFEVAASKDGKPLGRLRRCSSALQTVLVVARDALEEDALSGAFGSLRRLARASLVASEAAPGLKELMGFASGLLAQQPTEEWARPMDQDQCGVFGEQWRACAALMDSAAVSERVMLRAANLSAAYYSGYCGGDLGFIQDYSRNREDCSRLEHSLEQVCSDTRLERSSEEVRQRWVALCVDWWQRIDLRPERDFFGNRRCYSNAIQERLDEIKARKAYHGFSQKDSLVQCTEATLRALSVASDALLFTAGGMMRNAPQNVVTGADRAERWLAHASQVEVPCSEVQRTLDAQEQSGKRRKPLPQPVQELRECLPFLRKLWSIAIPSRVVVNKVDAARRITAIAAVAPHARQKLLKRAPKVDPTALRGLCGSPGGADACFTILESAGAAPLPALQHSALKRLMARFGQDCLSPQGMYVSICFRLVDAVTSRCRASPFMGHFREDCERWRAQIASELLPDVAQIFAQGRPDPPFPQPVPKRPRLGLAA